MKKWLDTQTLFIKSFSFTKNSNETKANKIKQQSLQPDPMIYWCGNDFTGFLLDSLKVWNVTTRTNFILWSCRGCNKQPSEAEALQDRPLERVSPTCPSRRSGPVDASVWWTMSVKQRDKTRRCKHMESDSSLLSPTVSLKTGYKSKMVNLWKLIF